MPVTADVLRNRCDFDSQGMITTAQFANELFYRYLVFDYQAAFHATLVGIAKNVKRSAAQTPQPGQQFECQKYPAAVFRLPQLAGNWITLRNQRRRQMKMKLVVAFELDFDVLHKRRIRVQARHLVLVLIREQLEVIMRDRFSQPGKALGPRQL